MRTLLLFGLFFAAFPFVLARPYFGVYLWTLFAYLNPHRLTWGATYDFPFAQLIAGGTLLGLLFTRDRSAPPMSPIVVVWCAFIAWMCITTPFALEPVDAMLEFDRTMKIQLFSFVTIILINNRAKLRTLVWIIALSIAFYGVRGGVASVLGGASDRVWGPEGSFIYDNNALGLAFVMTIPLLWYLWKTVENKKLKYAVLICLGLSIVSTLATYSRGALLGLTAITVFWMIHERKKLLVVVMLAIAAPTAVMLMPDQWLARMETIDNYEEDKSAMGRILAWRFATEISTKRLIGGGFGAFTENSYRAYAPDVAAEIDERQTKFQNSHSIYFGVLGQHGIPGLILFLSLGALTLKRSRQLEKLAEQQGAKDLALLAAATRIGIIGYAVTGAFANREYFDLYYHLVAIIVILDRELAWRAAASSSRAGQRDVAGTHPGAAIAPAPGGKPIDARLRR
jgi:probable O-glycosylation ligase (exosortase A-associated)